jgi:hypothetical protein
VLGQSLFPPSINQPSIADEMLEEHRRRVVGE